MLHSFIHLSNAIIVISYKKLKTEAKRFSWETEKANFKSFKFHQTKLTHIDFTCVFSIPMKFEIYFLGLP